MNTEAWSRAALGDVVESWIVGSTPPHTDHTRYVRNGGIPWAKAEDVKGGVLTCTAEQIRETGGRQLPVIKKDSVLLTTAGTIGRTAIAGGPMYCNQAVQALYFQADKVLPRFGLYFLQYRRPVLIREANTAVIPYISKRKLQSMEIWYPPISVQRRIVEYMHLAESLCEKAAQLEALVGKFLRMMTLHTAERSRISMPLKELLAGSLRSGLRIKASDAQEGIALVTSLAGTQGRLTSLAGCPRAQVSPTRIVSFGLQSGDILLRNKAREAAGRGVLVGRLPENALVGGNLIRLRLRGDASPAWLLSWLMGPGGDRVYAGGTLQKTALEDCMVPEMRNPQGFQRIFDVYVGLTEKAALFSKEIHALYEGMLYQIFRGGAVGEAFDQTWSGGGPDADPAGLAPPMQQFLAQMSQFQQELYRTLALSETEQSVHTLLKQMEAGRGRTGGIQDARSTMTLLEQFGFVERESARKIPVPLPSETADAGREENYVTDHNGRSIYIEKYKLTEDVPEEGGYAAGASENPKL